MLREPGARRLLDDRRVPRRLRLEKRARALLIAVARFSRGRAATASDQAWSARAIDALSALLEADQGCPVRFSGPRRQMGRDVATER